MSEIEQLIGREILDSRGNPTVEVEVLLESGAKRLAAVPSGASTWAATKPSSCRDGGDRYHGKGVRQGRGPRQRARSSEAAEGLEALDQRGIDAVLVDLDGTPNKSRLGCQRPAWSLAGR